VTGPRWKREAGCGGFPSLKPPGAASRRPSGTRASRFAASYGAVTRYRRKTRGKVVALKE
jgi:hypothetical protein